MRNRRLRSPLTDRGPVAANGIVVAALRRTVRAPSITTGVHVHDRAAIPQADAQTRPLRLDDEEREPTGGDSTHTCDDILGIRGEVQVRTEPVVGREIRTRCAGQEEAIDGVATLVCCCSEEHRDDLIRPFP